jgi:two-component system, OmpR family, manganese sensing sensor histidine kinase
MPRSSEQVPLDALLMDVIEEQQLAATARGIHLDLEIVDLVGRVSAEQPSEYNVEGDWNQLARLFTNLITNGVQYTPQHSAAQIKIRLDNTATHLRVIIQDQGIGIAAADLPRLLDRFYRVPGARGRKDIENSGGSGLGLSIVQSIVLRHQGELAIDSTPEQGTTVTVQLPLVRN